ncbi:MAG: 4'-phosphopantetheinyl transferase superfamily protein [Thermodesulfobacteriota bacterium]
MDFPLENCIVADLHFSAPQVQKLLQYQHLLTYVLLDLQLLEKEINKLGEEKALANNLSREELDLLSKFASAKRKREWLGGRFAAKYTAAQLLEQIESQKNAMHWSSYSIIADENGRPFLSVNKENTTQSLPDISISHSASMAAAMAVYKGYCGVDIQKVTPRVIKVSDRFCTHDEKQILQDFFSVEPEKQAAPLTKLWAAKEALRKASYMSLLPGFLELELIEITNPLQKKSGPWGFIFNWKNPGGPSHKECRVAVAHIEDYALALTARGDTVG